MTFGKQLVILREKRKLTAAEASRRMKINEAQLWNYEHEKLNPPKRYSAVLKMAEGLKLTQDEIDYLADLALQFHEQQFLNK